MVKYTGRGLVVKRPGVLSKVQMLNLVLGVGVFSLLPINQRKIKGQQLEGKIVSEYFALFVKLFQNFPPRTLPFKTKGSSSRRRKKRRKLHLISRAGQIDVAR